MNYNNDNLTSSSFSLAIMADVNFFETQELFKNNTI